MTKTIIVYALVAGFVTVGTLILVTRWVATRPIHCDAACKAERAKHWQRVAN